MAGSRKKRNRNRITYLYIGVLNACVAIMFVVILWPEPVHTRPIVAMRSSVALPQQKEPTIRAPIIGTPTRIQVPSIGIDVAVKQGDYNQQSNAWTIDTTTAFYATMTVPANNTNGTTLIYGHAGWGIFENLPAAREGAQALVSTAEGTVFTYGFESTKQVVPSDVSILTSSGPPRLVLQTCSGAFDSFRTLVTFRLKGIARDA